jgi:rod shape-determining protein MreC
MRTLTSRQRRAAVVLALIAVLFAAFDVVGAPFASARGGAQGFFGGLYRGTDSVFGPTRRWVGELPHLSTDRATIADQRAQLAALQRAAATRSATSATAKEVARLQLQANRGGYRVLPAHVIAVGPAGDFDWTVVLDAGTRDGARVGQTVIAGPNVVGRIVRVSASSTTVLLAADPDSGIGVRDQRSKQIGIAHGNGLAGYTFTGLDPVLAPKVGDVLVTGPAKETTYVAGLTVGTVSELHRALDGTVLASVRPAVSPTTLDLVGVVFVGGTRAARPALTPKSTPSVAAQGPR